MRAAGVHTLEVDGSRLTYHVAGDGPVCVVHPGGPGVGWDYLRLPELERRLTLVYLEPIGTGASARLADPSDYTLDRYVRCLEHLIRDLEIGPVWILGHSHGGFVALRLALAHPDLVDGLVLYATAARTGEEWMREAMRNVQGFADRHSGRAEVGDIVAALDEEATATTDAQLTSIFRRQFPIYFADYWSHEERFRTLRGSVRMYAGPNRAGESTANDLRDELARISSPCLVVAGTHDVLMPPRWARELCAGIARSELVLLERSGHFGHLEEPERFAGAIGDFIHRERRGA